MATKVLTITKKVTKKLEIATDGSKKALDNEIVSSTHKKLFSDAIYLGEEVIVSNIQKETAEINEDEKLGA